MSNNPLVKSVIRAFAKNRPPLKTPLHLNWELPQLLRHIAGMGDNQQLSHSELVNKCIALVMATTCARFTEIAQFSMERTEPVEDGRQWTFIVTIKNRQYTQPIVLHQMRNEAIDPIKAMCELRRRVRKATEKLERQTDTFWCDVKGNVMSMCEIRQSVRHLMRDAGIIDNRPYHIKHATISWLHKQNVPTDQIFRFIRHAMGSTTYLEYYLSEDLGAACTQVIEKTALLGEHGSEETTTLGKEEMDNKGGVWESNPLGAIATTINAAVVPPTSKVSAYKSRARHSSRK
jgi:hypothetical protein